MNRTQDDSSLTWYRKQAILTNIPFLLLLGLITVVINAFCVWAIVRDPLRTFQKAKVTIDLWMFSTQCLAGVILAPLIIADEIVNGVYSKNYWVLSTAVVMMTRWFIGLASMFMILTAVEGTGGITNPHLVRRVTTKRNIMTAVIIIIGTTLFYSLLLLFGVPEQVHSILFVHVFIILPLVVVALLFVRTYKRIRHPKEVIPITSVISKEKLKMSRLRNEKISRNFIRTIFIFINPFLTTAFSYYIFIMIRTLSENNETCEENRWCIVLKRLMLSLIFIHFAFTPMSILYKIVEYRNVMLYFLRKTATKICKK